MRKLIGMMAVPFFLSLAGCSSLDYTYSKEGDLQNHKDHFENVYVPKLIDLKADKNYVDSVVTLAVLDCTTTESSASYSCSGYTFETVSGVPVSSSSSNLYTLADEAKVLDDDDPELIEHTYAEGKSLFIEPRVQNDMLHLNVKTNTHLLSDIVKTKFDVVKINSPVTQTISVESHFTVKPNTIFVTLDSPNHYQSMIWVKN